jgi:alpha-amylase/alpha-mannosidase (GH57 family)
LQEDALQAVYSLRKEIYSLNDPELLASWRSLLTSDHFYYMCTKYAADGDVHKYFNPYRNPYEAYINYQNIISDFSLVLAERKKQLLATSVIPPIQHQIKHLGFFAATLKNIKRKIRKHIRKYYGSSEDYVVE